MATKLSNPAQTTILLAVLAGIGALCYFFLWMPGIASIEDIRERARDPKTSLTQIDEMLGDRPRSLLTTADGQPAYVKVQHCLISFEGMLQDKPVTRSQAEAEQLAKELLEKVNQGADFDEIVTEFTDDAPPGIYRIANEGFPGAITYKDLSRNVFRREGMAKEFGNVSFKLKVGEVGMANYEAVGSPFGWHIIKRLE